METKAGNIVKSPTDYLGFDLSTLDGCVKYLLDLDNGKAYLDDLQQIFTEYITTEQYHNDMNESAQSELQYRLFRLFEFLTRIDYCKEQPI